MYVPSSSTAPITRAYLAATYPSFAYTTNAIEDAVAPLTTATASATPDTLVKRSPDGSAQFHVVNAHYIASDMGDVTFAGTGGGANLSLESSDGTSTNYLGSFGPLELYGSPLTSSQVPSGSTDIVNKSYVDTAVAAAGGSGVATATANTVAKRDGTASCAFGSCKAEFFKDNTGNVVLYTTQTPHSTLVGAGSGGNLSGDDNTCTGFLAGQSISTGVGNSAFGRSAMAGSFNALTGSYNHADGRQAGYKLTGAATSNTFAGDSAGFAVTTGGNNVAVGTNCLSGGGTGTFSRSVGVGSGALNANTGSDNTAIGNNAGFVNTTGSNNTFLGVAAGGGSLITGTNMTCIGNGANCSASNTIQLGNSSVTSVNTAGSIVAGGSITSNGTIGAAGGFQTGTGDFVGPGGTQIMTFSSSNAALGKSSTVSGAITNATALGNGATVAASNTIQLGNASVTAVNTSGVITCGGVVGNASSATTAGTCTTVPALSGEATTSGSSNAVTLTNSAVIGKVLTGFTSGAGTVTSSDSILTAIQKIDANVTGSGGVSTATNNAVAKRDGSAGCAFAAVTATTLTASSGVLLPTSGGTAATLSHYEEYDFSTTFSGPYGTTVTVEFLIVRVGKQVTLSMKNAGTVGATGSSNTAFSSNTALPARFVPPTSVATTAMVYNGATPGVGNLAISNQIILTPAGGNFTVGQFCGFQPINTSWNVGYTSV